jgi:hypothetical protein
VPIKVNNRATVRGGVSFAIDPPKKTSDSEIPSMMDLIDDNPKLEIPEPK